MATGAVASVLDAPPGLPSAFLRGSNAAVFAINIAAQFVSQSGLLGPNNAEVSEMYPTPLTPAGWTFSIWGIIFGLQGLGVVYQLLPQGYTVDGSKARCVQAIGYWWVLGWLFFVAWQFTFLGATPLAMGLSVPLLFGSWVAFGTALLRLYRLKDMHGSLSSLLQYFAFFAPTSICAAWVSVASCVGVLVFAVAEGRRDLEGCATAFAVALTLLGLVTMHRNRDSLYGLTLVWALLGVYRQHADRGGSVTVRVGALVCLSLCLLGVIFSVLRRRQGAPAQGEGLGAIKAKHSEIAA